MGANKSAGDFFDALPAEVRDEGYIACPQNFLEHDQQGLSDTAFRSMVALAGATSPTAPVYGGRIAWLLPEGNRSSKATKAVRELESAKLVIGCGKQGIDTSPFWSRYPGLGTTGGNRFYRASRWLMNNYSRLDGTPRNLRVFMVVSSYFYAKNQMPVMSSTNLGRMLRVSPQQASKDLANLWKEKGWLDRDYPTNTAAPTGYGFTTFLRRLDAVLAPALTSSSIVTVTAPVSLAEVLDSDGSQFFGVADKVRANKDPDYLEKRGGRAKRRDTKQTVSPAPAGAKPEAPSGTPRGDALFAKVDRLAGNRLLRDIDLVKEEFRESLREIAEAAASGGRLSAKQRQWLYRSTAQNVLGTKWSPTTTAQAFAECLDVNLDPPRFSIDVVGFLSGHYFGKRVDMLEAVDIARQCKTRDEAIAQLVARGHQPVLPLPPPEEPEVPKPVLDPSKWVIPKAPTLEELMEKFPELQGDK